MLPGLMSKLSSATKVSAASISAETDIIYLTGTTSIDYIEPNFGGGFSGMVVLVPLTGNINITTNGNVADGSTAGQNKGVVLYFVKSRGKWYADF